MDFETFVHRYVPIRVLYWYNVIADKWEAIRTWWWKYRNF